MWLCLVKLPHRARVWISRKSWFQARGNHHPRRTGRTSSFGQLARSRKRLPARRVQFLLVKANVLEASALHFARSLLKERRERKAQPKRRQATALQGKRTGLWGTKIVTFQEHKTGEKRDKLNTPLPDPFGKCDAVSSLILLVAVAEGATSCRSIAPWYAFCTALALERDDTDETDGGNTARQKPQTWENNYEPSDCFAHCGPCCALDAELGLRTIRCSRGTGGRASTLDTRGGGTGGRASTLGTRGCRTGGRASTLGTRGCRTGGRASYPWYPWLPHRWSCIDPWYPWLPHRWSCIDPWYPWLPHRLPSIIPWQSLRGQCRSSFGRRCTCPASRFAMSFAQSPPSRCYVVTCHATDGVKKPVGDCSLRHGDRTTEVVCRLPSTRI
jgi:hypothetical protein